MVHLDTPCHCASLSIVQPSARCFFKSSKSIDAYSPTLCSFHIPLYGQSPVVFAATPHRIRLLRRSHLCASLPSNSQYGQGLDGSSITSRSKSSLGQI